MVLWDRFCTAAPRPRTPFEASYSDRKLDEGSPGTALETIWGTGYRLLESLLVIATSEARRGDRRGLVPVNPSLLCDCIGVPREDRNRIFDRFQRGAKGARPLEGMGDDPVALWRANAASTEPPMRGRPLGPGYRSGRIPAGGAESFAQLFLSGTGASNALSAPNGGHVAMRVNDPQAKTICKGEANRSSTCRWVPMFTQRYSIEVANLGTEDVRYFLVVE